MWLLEHRNRNYFIGIPLMAVVAIKILGDLYLTVQDGGHRFGQGDWLINSAGGLVRRAFGGDFILIASDSLGVDPLTFVFVAQISMIVVFLAIILERFLRLGLNDFLLFLLISPSFIGAWAIADGMAFRKEILILFAALPFLYWRKDI